ncbi:ATR-interacting protein mus304 [Phlebotomus papatasi]|uniref:ATR-interacting protein mus304 n=1 Tax=Phlebotomus papatasi TaxID=29031 RepID=UPI0024842EB8|nr:ATR-interacting protein mus304 [Phlebotomus papatasi]
MSKRYSSLFQDTFENKRARLDVKVASNVQINTNFPASSVAGPSRAPVVRSHVVSNNDLWDLADDEDDHFVLLASQAAEAMEQGEKVLPKMNVDNSEVSFSRFSKEVDSSTQVRRKSPVENVDFFGDDDAFKGWTDCFEDEEEGQKTPESEERLFKEPERNMSAAVGHAQDIQIDYLQKELMKLKKDNEKLRAEHIQMHEKFQTKDGEAATLRLELEQIRKNRITSQMKANAYAESNVKSLQAQIQEQDKMIKALEIEAKMRTAVKRHDHFSTQYPQQPQQPQQDPPKEPPKEPDYNLHLPSLEELAKHFETNEDRNINIFRFKKEAGCSERGMAAYVNDLVNLLSDTILGPRDEEETRIRNFFQVISKGVLHIKNYLLNLEYDDYKESQYIPALHIRHLNAAYSLESSMEKEMDLYQKEKLFKFEECHIGRRFLAIVAFACTKLPLIDCFIEEIPCKSDGPSSTGNTETIVKCLQDILHDISYTKNLIGYLGLVTASAEILCALAYQIVDRQEHVNLANDLFRMILLTRPRLQSMLALSRFLSRLPSDNVLPKFLEGLCHSSPKETFLMDEVYKIQRFTKESCAMQVFGALLESTCLELYHSKDTKQWYVDCVMELALNMINFYIECFGNQLTWIQRVTESNCDCYNKIGSSAVVLLHFCLNHWLVRGAPQDRKVFLIAQQGVLLLHYIFGVNFKETVLKNNSHGVKSRLQKVYNLAKHYHRQLQFKECHRCAINTLGMNLIVVDPLCTSQSGKTASDSENEFIRDLAETFFNTL